MENEKHSWKFSKLKTVVNKFNKKWEAYEKSVGQDYRQKEIDELIDAVENLANACGILTSCDASTIMLDALGKAEEKAENTSLI